MLVLTIKQCKEALDWIKQFDRITVDLETTGLMWWRDQMCGIAVAAGGQNFYFPYRHQRGENLDLLTLPALFPVLSNPEKTYLYWNGKFDMSFLYADGFPLPVTIEDGMLAAHLLNENDRPFALKRFGAKYIDPEAETEQTEMMEAFKKYGIRASKGLLCMLPADEVYKYAEQDVNLTTKLVDFFVPRLQKHGLYDLWKEVNRYEHILTRVELRGVKLDVGRVTELVQQSEEELVKLKARLGELAKYPINPASPKQLQAWLGLATTRHEELVAIQDASQEPREDIETLLMFRGWQKALGTYYKPFLDLRDQDDCIHPSFKLHGTVTGRLSCAKPNLQAIPRERPVMKVKDCIVARKGYTLVQADYSQAELRMGCHYAQELGMGELLKTGADIHQATADSLGITRQAAKAINFGILYGLGPNSLARNLRVDYATAKHYLDRYHAQYPRFRVLYRTAERVANTNNEIRLWTGRRRLFRYTLQEERRKAIANLVQGSVAEVVRVAMLKLDDVLPQLDIHIILQVHDSVLCEVPDDKVEMAMPLIKEIMEDPQQFAFTIPMKIDIQYGKRLSALVKWQPVPVEVAS